MNFTREQITNFVINWRDYHKAGKHKKKPYTIETDPPQTHYASDLTCKHHMIYSYLRNLPLDRGLKGSDEEKRALIRRVGDSLWWIGRSGYESYTKSFTDIFGPEFTTEIAKDFKDLASKY